MNTIEKPLTESMKEKCTMLKNYFESICGYVTKEQICVNCFGWEYNTSNERRVRDIIANVSHYYPILSTSDSKGYKLAKTLADVEDVKHTWAEHSKRIEEINKKIKPLMKFLDKNGINISSL